MQKMMSCILIAASFIFFSVTSEAEENEILPEDQEAICDHHVEAIDEQTYWEHEECRESIARQRNAYWRERRREMEFDRNSSWAGMREDSFYDALTR